VPKYILRFKYLLKLFNFLSLVPIKSLENLSQNPNLIIILNIFLNKPLSECISI
jgi:hypothetical protein